MRLVSDSGTYTDGVWEYIKDNNLEHEVYNSDFCKENYPSQRKGESFKTWLKRNAYDLMWDYDLLDYVLMNFNECACDEDITYSKEDYGDLTIVKSPFHAKDEEDAMNIICKLIKENKLDVDLIKEKLLEYLL